MGAWGLEPWANDAAADWLQQMFEITGIAQQIEEALSLPVEDHADEIRVAVYVLMQLSESYVWPAENRRRCLEAADARLSEILTSGTFTNPRLLAAIGEKRFGFCSRTRRINDSACGDFRKVATGCEGESVTGRW